MSVPIGKSFVIMGAGTPGGLPPVGSAGITVTQVAYGGTVANTIKGKSTFAFNDTTNLLTLQGNLTFGTAGSTLSGTTGSQGITVTGTNQDFSITQTGSGTFRVLPTNGNGIVSQGGYWVNNAGGASGAIGMFGGSNASLAFYVNNSERMRVTTTGSLLLGSLTTDSTLATLQGNGGAATGLSMSAVAKTQAASPYAMSATIDNRTVFTNEGASSLVTFNLPTAVANLEYSFVVQDTDGIRVVANTGDTLRLSGSVSASAGRIDSTTIGSTVRIVAINATEWIAIAVNGTWTVT